MDIEYRYCQESDLEDITQLHLKVFVNFFLPSLGPNFLQTYHRTSFRSEKSLYICAVDKSTRELIGFAHGTILSRGFYKRIIFENKLEYLKVAIRLLYSNPTSIFRLLTNLEKRLNTSDDGNYAELYTIGILNSYQGHGIGFGLIKKFESELVRFGAKLITLTTDAVNNERTREFYTKSGYSILYEFETHQKRLMHRLQKRL